ncbi:hypothetical protein [Microcella sp.]|jgi:hypothetical protein|uniref:hypothetical protein n=1 Tax=Microcella sp. TaxID=1913979 RepID=UPI003F6E518F
MSEATYIVCHELLGSTRQIKRVQSRPFLDWVKKPDGESDLAFRQLGFFGDRVLARARTIDHPASAPSKSVVMDSLLEVTGPHGLHLVLVEYRMPAATSTRARELRRPGLASTREPLEAAGFELDTSSNVRSTVISLGLHLTEDRSVVDGWLSLAQPLSPSDPSREVYRLMVLMVSIERQLISQAEGALARQWSIRGLHARRRVIRTLPRTPSTDKTDLADQFQALRASLHLDLRRDQVLDALEVRVRHFEFSVAIAAAGLAAIPSLAELILRISG